MQLNGIDCGLWVLLTIAAVLCGFYITDMVEQDMVPSEPCFSDTFLHYHLLFHEPCMILFFLILYLCMGNSQIPTFWLCDSCDTLQFLQLCAIIHLKSHTELQHPLITQYMSHIVYPYHVVPLSIPVPCYFHLHLHFISHIISNTFYISYSPLISFPWSAAGCYALCSLCSPPLLGESLEFSLWIPLARYASLSCVVFI